MSLSMNRNRAIRHFEKARQRARRQQLASRLSGEQPQLLPFELVRSQLRSQNPYYRGVNDVPLDQIKGSVGRYREFTSKFLPLSNSFLERWIQIENLAAEAGWPPVELYKVGGIYFVSDGHHRIAVAQQLKIASVEAMVWEYPTAVELEGSDQLDMILIKIEEERFLVTTKLAEMIPDHEIRFTVPGQYDELLAQIEDLRAKLSDIDEEPFTFLDTVPAWYEIVYLPVVHILTKAGLADSFKGRTNADLFAWISKHRYQLSYLYGDYDNLTDLVEKLLARYQESGLERMSRQVRNLFGANELPPLAWGEPESDQYPVEDDPENVT